MLYLLAIIVGIIAGLAMKGRISNLVEIRFNKVWLIISTAVLLVASQTLSDRFDFLSGYEFLINGIIFCMVFAWLWLNRQYVGMWVIAVGSLLNMIVMMVNGGRMPVDRDTVINAGLPIELLEADIKHYITSPGDGTRLAFLSDIIAPPGFLGYMMQVVSIGDLMVVAGLFLLFLQIVSGRKFFDKTISEVE